MGRAADAAVYPRQLCETIGRAVYKPKEYDRTGMACLGRGGEKDIRGFINSVCSREHREHISETQEVRGNEKDRLKATRPTGEWPKHWRDDKHEEDGGVGGV